MTNRGINTLQPPSIQVAPPRNIQPEQINYFTIDLSIARTNVEEHVGGGNFIWAIEATDNNASLTISFNDYNNAKIPFKKGMVIKGLGMNKLYFTNAAQSGKSITLMIVEAPDPANLQVDNPSESFSDVSLVKATVLNSPNVVSCAATSQTLLSAASIDKRETIIQNLDGTNFILIGNNTVTTTNGYYLLSFGTIVLTGTFAIYAYNTTGAAINVSVTEIKD